MSGVYEIVFDGGSKGNPGLGYGSYEISQNGEVLAHNLEQYGNNVTNNQAEYRTLVHALAWLADHAGEELSSTTIEVYGDSQLVIKQLKGEWKIKDAILRRIAMDARAQMDRFADVRLNWHPRAMSVKRLGH